MKIASAMLLPDINPNCILSIFTISLRSFFPKPSLHAPVALCPCMSNMSVHHPFLFKHSSFNKSLIIIIIWFGDTVTVLHLTKFNTNSKVPCCEYAILNRCVFKCFANASKLKEGDLKLMPKHSSCWGQSPQKI